MNTKGMQSATQRASDFAARLYSGRMTAEDEQALEAWLAEDPSHKAEYQAVLDTWYSMGELAGDGDVLAYAQQSESRPTRKVWPGFAIAASVLLTAALGLFNFSTQEPELMRYVTAVGEQKSVTLNDGSVMTLNTNTQVLIDYADGYRRAILDRGEVFFEVARDPTRPFRVDAGSRAVTVLGTSFNVYKAPQQLKVGVTEGVVAVHNKEDGIIRGNKTIESAWQEEAGEYLLKPGYLLAFNDKAYSKPILTKDMSLVADSSNWRHGSVRFDKTPLLDVVRELNRYSPKKILVEDNSVWGVKVSAVVHLDDLTAALDGMELGLPLQITYYSDRIVVVGKN